MAASDVAALVKQSVDIVDVVGSVVQLRRVGHRHTGLCPFHQEKTPSFHVDSQSQFYHCFGCGAGGDVISFVMKHRNLDFMEAVRELAERYHISLPEREDRHAPARGELDDLFRAASLAHEFFKTSLGHHALGRPAREYIARRGLSPEFAEAEGLGFAPESWDGVSRYLSERGISPETAVKAGLLVPGEKGRPYDRFRNRLIFPIADDRGRVAAFGGRSLDGSEPKYLNSPESPIYHKGRSLYMARAAREAARANRQIVLVEGYMDLLAFRARGFTRVVATLGTALTPQQARLLRRMADEVVLVYDADDAGVKASLRALPLFLAEGLPATTVTLTEGKDPDDFLRSRGIEAFEDLLKSRQDLGLFAVERALSAWNGTTAGKGAVLDAVKPVMEAVASPALLSEYVRRLAEGLSLSETAISKQFSRRAAPLSAAPEETLRPGEVRSIEENVVRVMVAHPELIAEVAASGAVEHFEAPRLRAIAEALVRAPLDEDASPDPARAWEGLDDEETRRLFSRFLVSRAPVEHPDALLRDWLETLRARPDARARRALGTALADAGSAGFTPEARRLLQQIGALAKTAKGSSKSSD